MSKVVDQGDNHLDGETLPSDAPVHLATLNTESLRTCRLSPNGQYLAFSTIDKLRIYRVECEDFNIQIQKVFSTTRSLLMRIVFAYFFRKWC